jgi:S1-C subfamily serine protease
MKSAVLFVLGLILGACAAPRPPAEAPKPLDHVQSAADLESKTVALVRWTRDGEPRPICAGVWVGQTAILTAEHCVDDLEVGAPLPYATKAGVLQAGGRISEPITARIAVVAAKDEATDLALLKVDQAPLHGIAHTTSQAILPGTFAQAMGHPMGFWWSYSSGEVSAIREMEIGQDILWVQTTTPISPGSSGGGLFDAQGHLMGLCHASVARGQNLNFFVHAKYIDAFLKGKV